MTEHLSDLPIQDQRLPQPSDLAFIGPRTFEQQMQFDQTFDKSYLSSSLPEHAKDVLHAGVEKQIARLAVLGKINEPELMSFSELHELRTKVLAARARVNGKSKLL